jgi:uncharacterized protein YbjQ (UPF0145 family)
VTSSDVPSRREEIREAVRKLAAGGYLASSPSRPAVTSELTIDETLILHSVGWEPIDMVFGVATFSIPVGFWQWGSGEIGPVTLAHDRSVYQAGSRMLYECQRIGGHGVVGVHIDVAVERHFINAVLMGTAIAEYGVSRPPSTPFISDLSGRDFALLYNAGWRPLGLAFGASFVYAPRRGALSTMRQTTQNVELTNYTEALYSARESAMEKMQQSASGLGAKGVVAVQVSEGPVEFARHAIRFTAWGTAITQDGREARYPKPQMVVPLDDRSVLFDVAALRGG